MGTATSDTTGAGVRTLANYIGGRWVRSASSELLDVTNPATGEPLARVPLSTAGELEDAVAAAREAFWGWRSTPVIRRAQWLFDLRAAMHERREEIAAAVTREMGKTLPDAAAEVARMVEMVECATAVPTTMQGRVLENVATGIDAETIRQPVGVCAAICPFNFPAMVPVVVRAVRARLRQHLRAEAVRAGAHHPDARLRDGPRPRRPARPAC